MDLEGMYARAELCEMRMSALMEQGWHVALGFSLNTSNKVKVQAQAEKVHGFNRGQKMEGPLHGECQNEAVCKLYHWLANRGWIKSEEALMSKDW